MKALNKETAPKAQRPERIIQFRVISSCILWIGLFIT